MQDEAGASLKGMLNSTVLEEEAAAQERQGEGRHGRDRVHAWQEQPWALAPLVTSSRSGSCLAAYHCFLSTFPVLQDHTLYAMLAVDPSTVY